MGGLGAGAAQLRLVLWMVRHGLICLGEREELGQGLASFRIASRQGKTGENGTGNSVCFREQCVQSSLFQSLGRRWSRTPASLLLHGGGNLHSVKEWEQVDTLGRRVACGKP